jgi:hypothetical protein
MKAKQRKETRRYVRTKFPDPPRATDQILYLRAHQWALKYSKTCSNTKTTREEHISGEQVGWFLLASIVVLLSNSCLRELN